MYWFRYVLSHKDDKILLQGRMVVKASTIEEANEKFFEYARVWAETGMYLGSVLHGDYKDKETASTIDPYDIVVDPDFILMPPPVMA